MINIISTDQVSPFTITDCGVLDKLEICRILRDVYYTSKNVVYGISNENVVEIILQQTDPNTENK